MPAPIFSHGHSLGGISLNALRAFEAAARHLSLTRAAAKLSVTQGAVSHQVKALEQRLGVALFRRGPRGLVLTDEGQALHPVLSDAFGRIARRLGAFERGAARETLTISVVGTFLIGWLLHRLPDFAVLHSYIDLKLSTNNNRVDLAGESLDGAIRFGDGNWAGLEATRILDAPFSVVCAPDVAARLSVPGDLASETLLRSYRIADWALWLERVGQPGLTPRGPLFDSSTLLAQAAIRSAGVALVPVAMFERELASGALVQPFATTVEAGSYWLTRMRTRRASPAFEQFAEWLSTTRPTNATS